MVAENKDKNTEDAEKIRVSFRLDYGDWKFTKGKESKDQWYYIYIYLQFGSLRYENYCVSVCA